MNAYVAPIARWIACGDRPKARIKNAACDHDFQIQSYGRSPLPKIVPPPSSPGPILGAAVPWPGLDSLPRLMSKKPAELSWTQKRGCCQITHGETLAYILLCVRERGSVRDLM